MDFLQDMLNIPGTSPDYVILTGIAISAFVIIYGLSGIMAGDAPTIRRMQAGTVKRAHGADFDLIQGDDSDPHGLLKTFVPSSRKERSKIEKKLRRAGVRGKHAVRSFYGFRMIMGIVLPVLFVGSMALPAEVQSQLHIAHLLRNVTWVNAMQVMTGLMVVGFYGPALWLHGRIKKRRQAIEHSLPNALDLMQVAMEAGLGFDAAMTRVSHELAHAAPEISQEFMMLQLELQAGKDRQAALLDMADRVGVEELSAFANVILQSNQFGTSVSTALNRFATDMRSDRELRAQEKANRLPVQMSAVMAMCMMPVLLMICLTPMAIRWMNMF
ncbi:type II secretion system F family protein [Roseovarius sp. PS-C2]|uniref:type II secretion system F family protein n=1 Tax=Roseovarius sp. PS-C2 TaxID=2820814 RepID=UPI001C0BF826|nr:type II secretion system F family protein [Roseovarius sp. PS-C2]MBU3261958.1 type II secretion system F family protein [Roseovarius sp. PS-C2]